MKEHNITFRISTVNADGKGEGSFSLEDGEERWAEIPFTVPGDLVEAQVKRRRSGVYPARLLTVIEPSPQSIPAKCVHFGACGGCSFQRWTYDNQVAWKEEKVRTLFKSLLNNQVDFRPMIAASSEWNYRNKMEFSFSENKEGKRFLGMILGGSRGKVFNLTECHLVSPWFSETLANVRSWWEQSAIHAYYPPKNSGSLRTLTLRESKTSGARLAMLTVSGNPDEAIHRNDLKAFQALFSADVSLFLRIHQAVKGQPTEFFEMHLQGPETIRETLNMDLGDGRTSTIDFFISPSAFFQPNTRQAERLYTEALKLAGLRKSDLMYDLYCGTGTLGALASRFVDRVLGIELSAESSLDARENAKKNGLNNIEVITGDVGVELAKRSERPSVLLLDPPRAGLDLPAIEQVSKLKPERLVYISCNPKTQARDIELFIARGFKLHVVQPVDQFPMTPHIENIALLTFTDH
jgi:23S rRNA (uracil1939-C5)-methyltransferase